ncbi:hypothetical protein SAMN04488134_11445 [Amphibacillus marinus]|uniref:Amidohydrolase 3 domain-containing protein n=1 Tax=Amphibacillus marinus TaxID=872970 RepID=A0A1H8T1K4_9BACI|nr:amidohydrolase [Amphibacillus marinus]SEO84860.1 hypothetical protein SAMN04488134_11445 [Amphibacillus marinus]
MGKLWYGGKIYTMVKEDATVEAVYTESGKIIEVGSYQDLTEKYSSEIAEIIKLDGKTMFPGFVDSHLHIIGHGEKLEHLDLSLCTSAEQVLQLVRERLATLAPGQWLFGEGWNDNQWDEVRIIDRRELDQLSTSHPILLNRICRHALIANTRAIQLAELSSHTAEPIGGRIDRDQDGRMTGYFLDNAQELIKRAIPDRSVTQLTELIDRSVADLLRLGLVGGHTEDLAYYGQDSFNRVSQAYFNSLTDGPHKFRAHLLVHHDVINDFQRAQLTYQSGTPFIEYGAMKIFSDGALGGRTAWLREPYADDPSNRGLAIHNKASLTALIKQARSLDLPVAIHAIGDQAMELVVELLKAYPLKSGARDRIIHAMIVNPVLIEVLKELNVVLDIQPTFVASDFPWVIERLGEKRIKNAYPWQTFLNEGIPCAAGSDAPIETVNPLYGIESFVLRKSSIDNQIYNQAEQLSVYDAISLYTKGSAFVIGKEEVTGQIKTGFQADFTILREDPFQVAADCIHQINVAMTVVDGEVMYRG